MSYSRFIGCVVSSAILGVVAPLLVNYVVDPYSVFGVKFFPAYGEMQERYLKVEHLKNHPDFNTFLIGGSRIGVVKTEDIDREFLGAKTYNLSLSLASMPDIEKYVEWLIKNIPNLSHVILQVDWLDDYVPRPSYALLTEVHPDISGRSRYAFLSDYLTHVNAEALRVKVDKNSGILNVKYDMSKGYWSRPLSDKKIEENCDEYVANDKRFGFTNNRPAKLNPDAIPNTLASIARIKSLLDKKSVKLTLLLSPLSYRHLNAIDILEYETFVKKLVNITDFYNFMYYNKITKNDCNYYEREHYRPLVGEMVVRALAQPNKQSEISRYVSKETIASHLEFLENNFLSERSR